MKTPFRPLNPDLHHDLPEVFLAGRDCDIDRVREYLKKGGDVYVRHPYHMDLMGMAFCHDSVEFLKLLLEFGYDPDHPAPGGSLPLADAIDSVCSDEFVMALIEGGASVAASDNYGITAVCAAICRGRKNILDELLARGANLQVVDITGESLLFGAVQTGQFEMAELLLRAGLDLNRVNRDKRTMLHMAAQRGDLAAVRWLIDHGADRTILDKSKMTPLDWARENQHQAVAGWLEGAK